MKYFLFVNATHIKILLSMNFVYSLCAFHKPSIMIKFINSTDILNVRNIVLRDNKLTPDECRFPTDEIEGAFHLG